MRKREERVKRFGPVEPIKREVKYQSFTRGRRRKDSSDEDSCSEESIDDPKKVVTKKEKSGMNFYYVRV